MSSLDVILVEDDPGIREILRLHFAAESWLVRETDDGAAALAMCRERPPDVIVLDLSLPGMNGIDVCRSVRAELSPSPGVVMVTARGSELDLLLGFEVGADDYVIKPCRPKEVMARVRAVGNRVRGEGVHRPRRELLRWGALSVDLERREVLVRSTALRLTATEFDLLVALARQPDRAFTRAELLAAVWETSLQAYARNVDCHVTRLRRKLEAAGVSGAALRSIHGVGYAFSPSLLGP